MRKTLTLISISNLLTYFLFNWNLLFTVFLFETKIFFYIKYKPSVIMYKWEWEPFYEIKILKICNFNGYTCITVIDHFEVE